MFTKTISSLATLAVVSFLLQTSTQASSIIDIEFTGLDIIYDGTSLYDAKDPNGGSGDPNEADPLTSVAISVDNVLAGPVITADAFIDVDIPVTLPLPASIPGSSFATSDSGIIDLLIGTTAPAFALALDVDDVTITFIDTGLAQFVFGAEVTSDVFDQDLPYGLEIGTPVEVSFSANVLEGTFTDDTVDITYFEAFGTGEFTGPFIPEPSSIALLALGAFGLTLRRRS